MSRTARAIGTIACAIAAGVEPACAHNLLQQDVSVNPRSQAAETGNAKFTYLATRGRALGVSVGTIEAARSIFYKGYLWRKTHLVVCFWNGSEADQRKVMDSASSWTRAAPILTFDFEEQHKIRICSLDDLSDYKRMADIRISMDAGDRRQIWNAADVQSKAGDWAYPGSSEAQNMAYPTTMNLADVPEYIADSRMSDFNFTVRHEFGHALGLVHEHQRSACAGWFNIQQIAHDTGWSVPFTQSQIGALPETSNSYGVIGKYDIKSVMQYNFSPSWYLPDRPGHPNPCRRTDEVDDLSDDDKVVIAELYQPELNQTPQRIAAIAHERAAAAVPIVAATPSSLLTTQKGDVEQALRTFQNEVGLSHTIQIQVFPHPADQDVVLRAVANLGFPILDESGKTIRTIGHPTKGLEGFPTNTVLFTKEVSPEDVRYVALALLHAGVELRSIEPYYPSHNNGFITRHNLIQVGSDI